MASVLQRMHEVRKHKWKFEKDSVQVAEYRVYRCYAEIPVEIHILHFFSLQVAAFQRVEDKFADYMFETKPEEIDAVCCLTELYAVPQVYALRGIRVDIFRSCLSSHYRRL